MTIAIASSKISRFWSSHPNNNLATLLSLSLLLIFSLAFNAHAGQATLAWDQVSDAAVAGYKLHYGTQSRQYSSAVDAGNSTSHVMSNLQAGTTYYFVVTAYDATGIESGYSNEVSYAVPAPDATLPVVTSFIVPSAATSLTVSVTAFTASDNVGVTGYLLSQTSSKPAPSDTGWTASPPTSYTFSISGNRTLYAWAKDAAGNVSDPVSTTIALTVKTGDILWRNISTGKNALWYVDGANLTGGAYLSSEDPTDNWIIVGRADFNGDGKLDILWRNTATGKNALWYMNGANVTGGAYLPSEDPTDNWTIVGTGDFNGDGKPDILWRNTTTGANRIWFMNGASLLSSASLPAEPDQNWKIAGR